MMLQLLRGNSSRVKLGLSLQKLNIWVLIPVSGKTDSDSRVVQLLDVGLGQVVLGHMALHDRKGGSGIMSRSPI